MLSIKILKERGRTLVVFSGAINGELGNALNQLQEACQDLREIYFNLEGIDYIDSLGVRSWVNFVRSFCEGRKVVYERCSPHVVSHINMIPGIKGRAIIESFLGQYVCTACDHTQNVMFETKDGYEKIMEANDRMTCDKCGQSAELEMEDELFFDFLLD